MISQYKNTVLDLQRYLIDGQHLGNTVSIYNNGMFDSTVMVGAKYKFLTKYEDAANITDKNIIPVLLITYPDQYLQGRILYNNQFVDIKTLLIKEENTTGAIIPKINFFIIPHFVQINEGNLGDIWYDLKIDYVTDYDTYGFMSKEIDSILKLHYYRKYPGEYHSVKTPQTEL